MLEHRTIKNILFLFIIYAFNAGCYYDNKQELYPNQTSCDTTKISYSKSIAPIMAQNCNGCHNQGFASGTWKTETHANLVATVNGGRLKGSIEHKTTYLPMPQGAPKLSACNLNKINAWINAKMPNN